MLFLLSIIFSTLSLAQKEFQSANSEIIETIDGDLDEDQVPEEVIIYNSKDQEMLGNIREIQILKQVNGKWTLLEKSTKAILSSEGGGMMGDPYGETKIKNGILLINQSGGSAWK